jgi:photosystem II stability/assembly factor-like uncharacterized protein
MTDQTKQYILAGLVIAAVVGVFVFSGERDTGDQERQAADEVRGQQEDLMPVDSIFHEFPNNHLHGLGYDSENDRIFLSTHYGIFIWQDGQLYQAGNNRDDFMGFSLHPENPDIIYTSGHPRAGGNMGVMKSEDGGLTFQQIYTGPGGRAVDFHSMSVSAANPDVLYAWFQRFLFRTEDGGRSWDTVSPEDIISDGFCWHVPCLAADTEDEQKVYAGTPEGLFVSEDGGNSWTAVADDMGAVGGVGVSIHNAEHLFAHSQRDGVVVSRDGGQTWEERNDGLSLAPREIVFGFAFSQTDPDTLFLATTGQQLYRSTDGGSSWEKIL